MLNLEEYIKPEVFKGLGTFLSWAGIIYFYFMVCEQVTVMYAGPSAELEVYRSLLFGEFAWLYYFVLFGGLLIPFILLVVPKTKTVGGITFASILVTVGFWVKRIVIVIPPLTRPRLPYELGAYIPTWVEWSLFSALI